jgi:hypothetical protein
MTSETSRQEERGPLSVQSGTPLLEAIAAPINFRNEGSALGW